uniref:C3HC-type domain-containing protein n=1 Tax=Caenorhabditis tropicalis TaxID=1561998 RepID=A0A1I7TXJ9_9PELO
MEIDATNSRHTIVLKRKANDTINDILNMPSSTSPQKRSKKCPLQKLRDVEAYKKIIKTYKAPTWYGCAVSPRDLADYGWSCVKKDLVQCMECEQFLCTALPNICKVSFNVYNSSLQEIHQKMSTAHRTTCKHRTGAPSFRINEPTSKEVMDGIQGRLADAKLINDDDLRADIPSDVNLPKFNTVPEHLVYVAALGWHVTKPNRGSLLLRCDYCARELAIRSRSGNKFDPIHNHERWCPQIDCDDHGEPSWQSDINIVLNTKNRVSHRYAGSSIYKEVCAARRMLDSSLSTIITPNYI